MSLTGDSTASGAPRPASRWIVSSCGTSVLRHGAPLSVLAALRDAADAERLDATHSAALASWVGEASGRLAGATFEEASQASAELHAICALWCADGGPLPGERHAIIATDTALGTAAAEPVAQWIERRLAEAARDASASADRSGCDARVRVVRPPGFAPRSPEEFRSAIEWLDGWLAATVGPARRAGARVVFSLNGGFKVGQGALQALAQRWADEVVYIFDGPRAELFRLDAATPFSAQGRAL